MLTSLPVDAWDVRGMLATGLRKICKIVRGSGHGSAPPLGGGTAVAGVALLLAPRCPFHWHPSAMFRWIKAA